MDCHPATLPGRARAGRHRVRRAAPAAVLALGWLLSLRAAAAAEPLEQTFHVDAALGRADAAGTAAEPLDSIGAALSRCRAGAVVTVRLAAGLHDGAVESFPIALPADVAALVIVGPADGAVEFAAPAGAAMTLAAPAGAPAASRYELSRLTFRGGDRGLVLVGHGGGVSARIESCVFAGQKLQALDLVAGELGSLDVEVRGCRVEGAPIHAIDLGTRPSSRLGFLVEDCVLDGAPSAYPVHTGVGVFLDRSAVARGRIRNNDLSLAGDAILVSTTPPPTSSGAIEIDIAGNRIRGLAGAPASSRHGIVLALARHHEQRVRIWHNTASDLAGDGIHHQLIESGPAADCSARSIDIAGNVLWRVGRGWSLESRADAAAAECARFARNGFEAGPLAGVDGNVRIDAAAFADASAGDLAPIAGGGLVDAGLAADGSLPGEVPGAVIEEVLGGVDVLGRCRFGDGDGDGVCRADLGAFELAAGLCRDDLAPFVRGDCAGGATVDVSDGVRVFNYLFLGAAEPACLDACDADDDGALAITDGILILNVLFLGTGALPPPHPAPGLDSTPADPFVCAH